MKAKTMIAAAALAMAVLKARKAARVKNSAPENTMD